MCVVTPVSMPAQVVHHSLRCLCMVAGRFMDDDDPTRLPEVVAKALAAIAPAVRHLHGHADVALAWLSAICNLLSAARWLQDHRGRGELPFLQLTVRELGAAAVQVGGTRGLRLAPRVLNPPPTGVASGVARPCGRRSRGTQ
jgi:hypothetical protein